MKSTDVKHVYSKEYFLHQVDGFKQFEKFDATLNTLFERYKRNIDLLDLHPENTLLEFGCGRGEVVLYHAKNGGKAVGSDYSYEAILMAKKKSQELKLNTEFINGSFDSEELNKYETFDRILAAEFIEHISEEECCEFLKIVYQKLSSNGQLLIFTHPNTLQRKFGYKIAYYLLKFSSRKMPKIQDDTLSEHYRFYHLNEQNFFSIKKRATEAGFGKIHVFYDSMSNKKGEFLYNILRTIIRNSPLKHIFQTNICLIAQKD